MRVKAVFGDFLADFGNHISNFITTRFVRFLLQAGNLRLEICVL
ncbi:hypothetical protein PCAR4_150251 [Paraburkholderia caribensis]|nr:hypothetical protein PCAR4_150251 [Paraburkholderia caribensis]